MDPVWLCDRACRASFVRPRSVMESGMESITSSWPVVDSRSFVRELRFASMALKYTGAVRERDEYPGPWQTGR